MKREIQMRLDNYKSMWRAVIQGCNLLHVCLLELNTIFESLMLRVNFPAVS